MNFKAHFAAKFPLSDARRVELAALVQSVMALDEGAIKTYPVPVFAKVNDDAYHLFRFDPNWHTPLLETVHGLRMLSVLVKSYSGLLGAFLHHADTYYMMKLCLAAQAYILAAPDQAENILSMLSSLSEPIFKAILHYIHPNQADALDQLIASMPNQPPAMPSSRTPLESLPKLFPTLDTTQFAPKFDWFMYLLTQFSPVDKQKYKEKLATILAEIVEPTAPLSLKLGLSIDRTFVFNNLINSYDEYLEYKLSDQREQQGQEQQSHQLRADPQPPSQFSSYSPSLLFPYFPNPHPIHTPIALSQALSKPTPDFAKYAVYMFTLGPYLNSPTGLPPTLKYPTRDLPLAVSTQLCTAQYRSWYRSTAINSPNDPSSITNTNTNAMNDQSTPPHPLQAPSSQQQTRSPPDFTTNPFTILQLTLVPVFSLDSFPVLLLNQCPIEALKAAVPNLHFTTHDFYHLLFLIISHCFPDQTKRDEVLEQVVIMLLSADPSSLPQKLKFSSTLYQHSYTTLHQHLYNFLLSPFKTDIYFSHDPFPRAARVWPFLTNPFSMHRQGDCPGKTFTTHITLCVHAGFLAPGPLPPLSTALAKQSQGSSIQPAYIAVRLYHELLSFRAFLHAYLTQMTGFLCYLPQSSQLLASAVYSASSLVDLENSNLRNQAHRAISELPFLVPHALLDDPRDSISDLKRALVGDNGKLYALEYSSAAEDQGTGPKDDKKKAPWWPTLFASQGAPRHQHLYHGTAIDDIRVAMNWDSAQVSCNSGLGEGQDCCPYDRPRILAEDLAWIESEENQTTMRSPETHELQKKLTAYYQQVLEAETNIVIGQMQKVMLKADKAGLFDASNASPKRKQPPSCSIESVTTTTTNSTTQPQPHPHHPKTYPFPDVPAPGFEFIIKQAANHDTTFTKPRGVLQFNPATRTNCFYDHNYSLVELQNTDPYYYNRPPPEEITETTPIHHFDKNGLFTDNGPDPLLKYFRQRSEWALELLIVGCLGLQPTAATIDSQCQQLHALSNTQPSFTINCEASYNAAHLQYCKDQALQRLPSFADALHPTALVPPPGPLFGGTPPHPQALSRLSYYHDTLTQLTFLSTLPLYETLLSLPLEPLDSAK